MNQTLILGFGNYNRQDDGAAWHLLTALANRLNYPGEFDPDVGIFPQGQCIDLCFVTQLTPELAETIAKYTQVCFVDAHTGEIPEDISIRRIHGSYQPSSFTHHMTPESLLALSQILYGGDTSAILASIRGTTFGYSHELSKQTASLIAPACEAIMQRLVPVETGVSGYR